MTEEQDARAELKERFFGFLEKLEGREATLQLYEKNTLSVKFLAMQANGNHYIVENLKTPTGVMEHAMESYFERVLKECGYLADMYMLDFFVESLWEKLPVSWRSFYESQLNRVEDRRELVDFVKWILRRPNGEKKDKVEFLPSEPEPLSMTALRNVVHIVCLKQWKPIGKPSEVLSLVGLKKGSPELNSDNSFTNLKTVLPSSLRLKIKNKKEHEITRIVDVVKILLESLNVEVEEIVDIGAGIGHLSRILSLLLPERKVSTIEGDADLVDKASKIDEKITKNKKYLDKAKEGKSEFLPLQRKALFIKNEEEISCFEGRNLFLTGLHTCGDFSATIVKHFVANSDAKILLHFGCCYHKLNGGKDKIFKDVYENSEKYQETSQGFPLSKLFSKLKLSYAAREIACFGHEQFIQKLTESLDKKVMFVNSYRAIFEWIILDCPENPAEVEDPYRHKGLRGFRGAESMDFWKYTVEALRDQPEMKEKFDKIIEKRPYLKNKVEEMIEKESFKVLILYTFRLLIAPVVEALVLRDREQFLKEQGIKNTFLFPLFDPMLSPRNVALVSWRA
ncbi:hypothetical protein FO519_003427 [Halicephalobus sp. NKZ332]|nr:hypothetical protein FO519_003427 [Halicephalobus sp. NKZ332]